MVMDRGMVMRLVSTAGEGFKCQEDGGYHQMSSFREHGRQGIEKGEWRCFIMSAGGE